MDDPAATIVNSESFKTKIRLTGKKPVARNTKNVQKAVPLKYLSTFWRTIEMPITNSEINLMLNWSKNYVISSEVGEAKFTITDKKLYVPIITLSNRDNVKLFEQLKSCFKRTINWNKYQDSRK